ncbi:hypothetical protein BH18ACT15_BH18ACT15_15770 [soil metagenome]
MRNDDRAIIEEQIRYYDHRASEYDDTFDLDGDSTKHGAELCAALDAFSARGKVLELACGTGKWTSRLVTAADSLTAVDASPAMLALNRHKVGDPRVHYERADIFEWEPAGRRYDVVTFFFWLSHVPPRCFDSFWQLVERCLSPGGRVFFGDEARHDYWDEEYVTRADVPVVRRRLKDGSEHRAVKVFWEPDDLERELARLGWSVQVHSTGVFYWGSGGRASQPLITPTGRRRATTLDKPAP